MITGFLDFRRSERARLVRRPSGAKLIRGARQTRKFKVLPLKQIVADAPRWWLCFLLIIAPWAYGATTPWIKDLLADGLLLLIGLFTLSLILRHRWPRIHWLTAGLSIWLLVQGWLMTWNAKLFYDHAVFYFHHVQEPLNWLPGTVDQATSLRQMLLITGLFGAFWVGTDLAANPSWRERLWLVMSLTGVSIMILGLLQRVTSAPAIFWQTNLDCGPTFFATYRYHANAGAFINIVLPLITAKMLLVLRRKESNRERILWILAFICTLVSAFVNVSRAATLISLLIIFVFLVWELRERARTDAHFFNKRRIAGVALIFIFVAGLLVWAVGFNDAYRHWTEMANSVTKDDRFVTYDVIVKQVIPASSWWGFGPATFQIIFPFFTNSVGTKILGIWEHAHQDYLETLVEWGFAGAAAWFLLFGSVILRAGRAFRRWNQRWDSRFRTFAIAGLIAVVSVIVHATTDFPLQIASLQLYASVILGLLSSLEYNGPNRRRRGRESPVTAGQEIKSAGTQQRSNS